MKYHYFYKDYFGIIITLFFMALGSLNAKDAALNLADQFFKMGNYEAAITEYKRYIYFNPAEKNLDSVYYNLGLSYRCMRNWTNAIDAIRQSMELSFNDSIKYERKISIAIIKVASGNHSAAEFDLLRIVHFSDHPFLKKKALFFLGVVYLYNFKWKEAENTFAQYFSDSQRNVDSDFLTSLPKDVKYKSPALAKWLSTFIPGAGQLYCGDIQNGLNAFALNSFLGYLLIDSLIEHRFQDAVISFYPLFERYYGGNRYNAERIAKLHNNKINKTLANIILIQLKQKSSYDK